MNVMRFIYLFSILTVFNALILAAQDTSQTKLSASQEQQQILRNKLGFAASMLSGYGLSYSYQLDRQYTIELTASIYGQGGENNNSSFFVSTIGAEIQRNFYANRETRFYGMLAGSYWLDNTEDSFTIPPDKTSERDYIIGLAIGIEYSVLSRLAMNIEGGYLYRYTTTTRTNNYYSSKSTSSYWLGFGVGCGIYYMF